MFEIPQMVLWLTGLLLGYFDPQKTEVLNLWGDMVDFYY